VGLDHKERYYVDYCEVEKAWDVYQYLGVKRIGEVKLEELSSKHYSTDIKVEVGGKRWDEGGRLFHIGIYGIGTTPSHREYEKGCYSDDDMNHVESEEHYQLAMIIMKALRDYNED